MEESLNGSFLPEEVCICNDPGLALGALISFGEAQSTFVGGLGDNACTGVTSHTDDWCVEAEHALGSCESREQWDQGLYSLLHCLECSCMKT